MKSVLLCALLFTAAGAILLPAAESDQPTAAAPGTGENTAPSGGGRTGRGGRGGFNPEAFQKFNEEIKAKFPTEYAEIEKLQQTDRRAAFSKMRELAEKGGISMPFGNRGDRRHGEGPGRDRDAASEAEAAVKAAWQQMIDQLKEKFPAEYAEIEKLLATDARAALEKLQALAAKAGIEMPQVPAEITGRPRPMSIRNANRMLITRANRMLRQRNPEAYAALEKLRQEDEDAAREQFRAMVKEAGITLEQLRRHDFRDDENITVVNQDDLTGIAAAAIAKEDDSRSGSSRRSGRNGSNGGPAGGPPDDGGNPPPPPRRRPTTNLIGVPRHAPFWSN